MRPGRLALLLVSGALLGACPGGGAGATTRRSPPDGSSGPPPTLPSVMHTTAGRPTSPPPGRSLDGTARLEVTGAARATVELPRLASRAFAPGGGFAFVWGDSGGNSLGVGGPVFRGSR